MFESVKTILVLCLRMLKQSLAQCVLRISSQSSVACVERMSKVSWVRCVLERPRCSSVKRFGNNVSWSIVFFKGE